MAKKKDNNPGFKVDNMTVEEILTQPINFLNSLDEREMSRALRTAALAANKRLAKLKKYANLTSEGYRPTSSKKSIATDALNWVTQDGKLDRKFGVKSSKDRNDMYKQLGEIRQFMNMKSSTVSGAVQLRKTREEKIFGKTREKAARGKDREAVYRTFDQNMRDMWSAYHKFMERKGYDAHSKIDNSDRIQSFIGRQVVSLDDKMTEEIMDQISLDAVNEWDKIDREEQQKAIDALKNRAGRFPQ